MKKQVTILLSAAVLFFAFQLDLSAQKGEVVVKKSSQEEALVKQAEAEKARVEELFKKKLIDSKTKQEELLEIEEKLHKQRELLKARTLGVESDELLRAIDIARDNYATGWTVPESNVYVSSPENYRAFFNYGRSSNNSSTMQYTKNVVEANFTKDFEFEVDDDANRASIDVSGSCKEGEIRIKISMPDGKLYTEVLIDEYGSVNWSKSFEIDEEDRSKAGTWKFLVSAKDATGNFRLSLRSN